MRISKKNRKGIIYLLPQSITNTKNPKKSNLNVPSLRRDRLHKNTRNIGRQFSSFIQYL